MRLDRQMVEKFGITAFTATRFNSRRNRVYMVRYTGKNGLRGSFVLKIYERPGNCAKESALLTALRRCGVNVPEVYHADNRCIAMEFVRGETLFDVIDRCEKNQIPPVYVLPIVNGLCAWLKGFYVAAGKIYGHPVARRDVNLRNFIATKDGIYGIDFENCCEGNIEEDVGKLCAFLVTYEPAFTPWKKLLGSLMLDRLAEEFGLDRNLVVEELNKELGLIEKRRGLFCAKPKSPFLRW